MDLIITIISEKHCPTLTVKMDSEESALFALHLIDVFADEVSLEDGLIVRGRTYQQKTPELTSNLRMFIENHGSRKELWQLYEIISELSDGEYYAVITQAINESELNAIKENLLHLNHPDYDELMKFKTEYCIGVLDNYDVVHYDNGKDQIKIGEADKSKRKCRFCGRMMPEVSYKKVAHTISEGLGNKCIITNDECDDCNETLGKEIEQDLITYLSPLRTFMSINGKNGKGKIKDDSFALYEDGAKSMKIDLYEKESPKEKHWKFEKDDLMWIFTHTGINACVIDVANEAHKRGMKVIVCGSASRTGDKVPRHSCGKNLFQIADYVIDTCCPLEDASVPLKNHFDKIGPLSTMASVTCVWMIITTVCEILADRGVKLHINPSHNVPGDTTAHERLDAAIEAYRDSVQRC